MCGRYSGGWDVKLFEKLFNVQPTLFDNYNVSPTQYAPVIWQPKQREVLNARWGLMPSWVSDPKEFKASMFNARAETLHDKPSFKKPFKSQRCIVPALGFFEWKKEGNTKTPHFIHRNDGELLAFAGLYDHWQRADDEIYSYTIITTTPNQVMESIHDRMPVILEQDQFNLWLEGEVDQVEPLLKPFEGELEAYEVDKRVGKASESDKGLLEQK
jgi:putative SOS response-associated peptidase YedK